jgi:hypothetical protein
LEGGVPDYKEEWQVQFGQGVWVEGGRSGGREWGKKEERRW